MSDQQMSSLKLLGLEEGASKASIDTAYTAKRSELQGKQQSAPTPPLADKFTAAIAKLDQAYQQLGTSADSSSATQDASARSSTASPLSQTKLDDLPGLAPEDLKQLSFEVGHVLAGRYTIKELVGQGGMGAVYRAHDKNRDEDIALKILLPSLTGNERALARFMDEARISSKLSHRNIVNVYDVQNDGDLYFLTMELLQGQDLRQVMENQQLVGRPIDIDDVKAYLAEICTGLSAAHEHTVHRDIKPENIWLCDDGKLKLMDFGIAQLQSTSRRTQTGAAMGTAYYMAPEQLKGLKDIDGRADQYAVGVLAYELLTGEVPAGAIEPVNALRKDIPKGMAAAIMQSLSPRPENRFATIDTFAEAIAKGKGKSPRQKRPSNSLPTGEGPNQWLVAALVLITLLGVGALAYTGVWKDWMPASKAEIAREKAGVAKLQGEIKVIKQRLETARRSLDSDVRDAERNESNDLNALDHWQRLTEAGIFSGNQIPGLEGDLAVGETLLSEGSYSEAHLTLSKVRDGYKTLQQKFNAAKKLHVVETAALAAKDAWLQRQQAYNLPEANEATLATQAESAAKTAQYAASYAAALNDWQTAQKQWQAAYSVAHKLHLAQRSNTKAKEAWLTRQTAYGLPAPQEVGLATAAEASATATQQNGDFLAAKTQWQIAQQYWQAAYSVANKLHLAQRSNTDAKEAWLKRKKAYRLPDPKEVGLATAAAESATATQQNGDFLAAKTQWQTAEKQWQAAYSVAQTLHIAHNNNTKAKDAWLKRKKAYRLPEPKEATLAAAAAESATATERNGDFLAAKTQWQTAEKHWQTAYRVAQTLHIAHNNNTKAKDAWLKRKKAYGLPDSKEATLAATAAEESAIATQRNGDFLAAKTQWQTAEKQWQAAYSAVADEVSVIDLERAKAEAERIAKAAAERKAALLRTLNFPMVPIPGGSFRMGDLRRDGLSWAKPVHSVRVPAFKMSQHEITFAAWDACVSAGGCSHRPDDQGWGRGNRPVINVSWNDITQQFIPWLNQLSGKRYRLPSEAEWEYAARAGSSTEYSWGDSVGSNRANCANCGSQWDNSKTAPVGSFSANRFGLYDMHGNVWEWTQDCYHDGYNRAPTNGSAWTGGSAWSSDGVWTDVNCGRRVWRSGSWRYNYQGMRASSRWKETVTYRDHSSGFRLVQD
jgi:formylglycine-generating enzyme required for sulfatase activity/serine/threonine protein kinase